MSPRLPAVVSSSSVSFSAVEPQHERHPAPDPEHLSLVASLSRPWEVPCVSAFLAHHKQVPRLSSPAVQSISPRWGTARYCAKKAIGERRSVGVTSNPAAFVGKRVLLMEVCSSRSCPTNMGSKASTISSSSPACETKASGGTKQHSKDKGATDHGRCGGDSACACRGVPVPQIMEVFVVPQLRRKSWR